MARRKQLKVKLTPQQRKDADGYLRGLGYNEEPGRRLILKALKDHEKRLFELQAMYIKYKAWRIVSDITMRISALRTAVDIIKRMPPSMKLTEK